MTSSAATEPRASRVWPPCDCATRCALVLECMWTKLHRQFFLWNLWNHFSLVWSFKGVGPRRITVHTGCLGLSFWVLSTNWHDIMCILNSYMRASYSCISWRASLKSIVIMHHDVCIIESDIMANASCHMHHFVLCMEHPIMALHWHCIGINEHILQLASCKSFS